MFVPENPDILEKFASFRAARLIRNVCLEVIFFTFAADLTWQIPPKFIGQYFEKKQMHSIYIIAYTMRKESPSSNEVLMLHIQKSSLPLF